MNCKQSHAILLLRFLFAATFAYFGEFIFGDQAKVVFCGVLPCVVRKSRMTSSNLLDFFFVRRYSGMVKLAMVINNSPNYRQQGKTKYFFHIENTSPLIPVSVSSVFFVFGLHE